MATHDFQSTCMQPITIRQLQFYNFFKRLFQFMVCHPEYGATREEKITMLVGLCCNILLGDQVVGV